MQCDKVFVYGTLKRGNGLHGNIEDHKFIDRARVKGFDLYDLGPFPAIVHGGDERMVFGEVFELQENTMDILDMVEGYPNLYDRQVVEYTTDSGEVGKAWVYFMHDTPHMSNRVEGGEW